MRELPPRRGEIWNVDTPNQPSDPHQPRPALVISADERNLAEDDLRWILPRFDTIHPEWSTGQLEPPYLAEAVEPDGRLLK